MLERNSIGLDTTVVLRLLTAEPQKQFEKARKFIEEQLAGNKKLFISDLVVAETYFALHYHYKVPKPEAIAQLDGLLSSGIIHAVQGGVCQKVLKESLNHKAGFVDQIIHGQYCLLTEEIASFDKSMGRLPKVIAL
ncbi:MAG: PIN domain-containing protein [Candidatus Omnitrophica bacterium]|nr:PIN domain-containing protein [Candidatus Omnitrophota bacterium]